IPDLALSGSARQQQPSRVPHPHRPETHGRRRLRSFLLGRPGTPDGEQSSPARAVHHAPVAHVRVQGSHGRQATVLPALITASNLSPLFSGRTLCCPGGGGGNASDLMLQEESCKARLTPPVGCSTSFDGGYRARTSKPKCTLHGIQQAIPWGP